MKILILDKEISIIKRADETATRYSDFLKERGHEVRVSRVIDRYVRLGSYDLAIVHPFPKDAKRIAEEMSKRKSFRVMVKTSFPSFYGNVFHKESKQLIAYAEIPEETWDARKNDLATLLEKGWSD